MSSEKGSGIISNILQRDGLTIELLASLSYRSALGLNLKKNLHYFDKDMLIAEINQVNAWYDEFEELHELALDYRIKKCSVSSFEIQPLLSSSSNKKSI